MSSVPLSSQQQRLLEWVKSQVSALLGYPDDGQISSYLLSLHPKAALLDYANNLFGPSNPTTTFVSDLWSRRADSSTPRPPFHRSDSDDTAPSNPYGVIDNDRPHKPAAAPAPPAFPTPSPTPPTTSTADAFDPSRFRGVKVKFAKPKKGAVVSGARGVCQCQGREHEVFANCTVCGRVLCVVEGEGECAFCQSWVTRTHTQPSEAFIAYMEGLNLSRSTQARAPLTLTPEAQAEGLERAEAQKRKLLDFSATNVARSRVIDQQADYFEFEGNAWMGAEEKEERMKAALLEEEKLHKRRAHTVSIDLVTGQVIAHSSDPFAAENRGKPLHSTGMHIVTRDDEDRIQREAAQTATLKPGAAVNAGRSGVVDEGVNRMFEEMKTVSQKQYFTNDTLTGRARVVYEQMQASLEREKEREQTQVGRSSAKRRPQLFTSRLQHDDDPAHATFDQEEAGIAPSLWGNIADDDDPLPPPVSFDAAGDDEPSCAPAAKGAATSSSDDSAMALSMWQPYASLLVLGIKSRGWSTPYRGRLWIASTAKQSTEEENAQLEAEYRDVYPGLNVPFPSSYPHSALLGCVDLVDVLSQEEFQRMRQAKGERENSASAFVFVCERPRVLPLPISVRGEHKLWQLPKKLVEGLNAANTLVPVSEKWRTGKSRAAKEAEQAASEGTGTKRKTLVIKSVKKKGPRMPNED